MGALDSLGDDLDTIFADVGESASWQPVAGGDPVPVLVLAAGLGEEIRHEYGPSGTDLRRGRILRVRLSGVLPSVAVRDQVTFGGRTTVVEEVLSQTATTARVRCFSLAEVEAHEPGLRKT